MRVVRPVLLFGLADRRNGGARHAWQEVDIDSDPELQRRFTDEIPVVFIDGRKAFKYHMEKSEFLRVLKGRG